MKSWERTDERSKLFEDRGLDRRDFIRICTLAAAAVGLPAAAGVKMAEAAAAGLKPSVIWLHFQECTGCTESLLRTSHPALAKLILDLISLDYHETLFAAAGHQAEAALKSAMEANAGKYVCVVEGAIPTKDDGIYCKIGGRTALEIVNEVAEQGRARSSRSARARRGAASRRPTPTRPGAMGAPHGAQGQDGGHDPRLPGEPVQPPRHGAAVRDPRHAAGARRQGPADVRLRPHHPRALPAARALRRRPLRAAVRRRGPPPGLLPLQDRAARARRRTPTARRMHFGEVDGRLADRPRPPLRRLHRADASPSACRCTTPSTIERPTPPDTYPPIHGGAGERRRRRDRPRRPGRRARALGAGWTASRRSWRQRRGQGAAGAATRGREP